MIQNTTQAKAGGIPRLAMINSFAGYGRCSTTIALPVVSVMKVQGCPVPTSVLSNHLAFPACYFDDYTSHMSEYLQVWEKLQVTFDGLYCGFLGSVEQIDIVKNFLASPVMRGEHAHPIFLLDPVMGDHGRTYSSITQAHCEALKELAALADILTPNITEACLLTDTPYKEGRWTDGELADICRKLADLKAAACQGHRPTDQHYGQEIGCSTNACGQICAETARPLRIVITGLQEQNRILNYIWEDDQNTSYYTEVAGSPHHGTGDLFASILAADALHDVPFARSVQKASEFVALCIKGTEEAGTPERDGVLFEKYLYRLCK